MALKKDIQADVRRMREFVHAVADNKADLAVVMENPVAELGKFGIDLKKYSSTHVSEEQLAQNLVQETALILATSIERRVSMGSSIVARTSASSTTAMRTQYNWDLSASSTTHYESDTETFRGVHTYSQHGSYTGIDEGFNIGGASLGKIREALTSPLISAELEKTILSRAESRITAANTMVGH